MNEEEIHSSEPFWSQRPTKVYLTINHPEFSSAMAGLLHGRSDLNIVGRANTIQKTLFELQKIEVDVLVLDICMGEEGSLEAVQGIRQLHPKIKILVTTDGGHEDQQVASILARAD
ncbi:MAG: hypothetical protein QOG91_442, partial [Candidatus Parcubacteria bacterium]|nr:hypothetical protein [Candidatus Parcubacteria bacterium]